VGHGAERRSEVDSDYFSSGHGCGWKIWRRRQTPITHLRSCNFHAPGEGQIWV